MLIGNGSVLHKSPARFLAGTTTSVAPQMRANFGKQGMLRNRFYQDKATTALSKYSIPEGTYAGTAWMLPQSGGGMASFRDATMTVTPAGTAYGGITTTGSASLSIVTNTPAGQLIISGSGSAALSILTNTPLLTALISGTGSASFVIAGDSSTMSGTGSASGSAGIVFNTTATIYPTNDASPLRTGAANFAITGTLTPYAIGSMSGSTIDLSALTPASILAAMNAAPPAVNIKKVNDVTVNGTGSPSDTWGP